MHYNPQEKHIELMRHAPRTMKYDGSIPFEQWQETARLKLAELLGLPLETPETDGFHIEYDEARDDFREIRFTFASEPLVDVCCYLLLPKEYEVRLPMVICLQGHTKGCHISLGRVKYEGDELKIREGDRDFGLQIVRRGQAALVMEQRAFGERGGSPAGSQCGLPAMSALLLGRTLVGERVWDVMRGIDCVLAHFDMIDAGRIALMGQSGGGTVTCYAGALEKRLAAVMPASSFCGYLESIGVRQHCACNYVPGIMKYFDMGDLAGMTAPRPMVVVGGMEDPLFPLESANREFAVAQEYYRIAGAPENVRHVIGKGGHRFYAADSWPVFDDVTGWRKE